MPTTDSPKKQIVYESRPKFIALLLINSSFVLMSLWTGYVWGWVFFGLCGLVTAYPLLDPRKELIFFGTKKYQRHINQEFVAKRADQGIFTYTPTGFTLNIAGEIRSVLWHNVHAVFAYKRDMYTVDEICIDVFYDDRSQFTITEDTAGWYVFCDCLAAQFPTIKPSWIIDIMAPAFEPNTMLLYEHEGRSLEQALKAY